MSDFEQRKPKVTRGVKSKRATRGWVQTTRTAAEQSAHTQARKTAHKQRSRVLEAAAKARAIDFHSRYSQPITGVGPFGQFTLAQLLCIEFAQKLPVEELRTYKTSKRKVHLSHATTARLHAAQLNAWHEGKAAKLVRYPFVCWDEGTAGGFSTGVPGLVAGVCGLLADDQGDFNVPYNDMLGLVLLQAKTGLTVFAAMARLLERRGFEEFYFCGTDAVTSNVGHLNGAIAYFRKEYQPSSSRTRASASSRSLTCSSPS